MKTFHSELKDWFQWGAAAVEFESLSDVTASPLPVTAASMEVTMPSVEEEEVTTSTMAPVQCNAEKAHWIH